MATPATTTLVVLFNLKPGASAAEYEKFAREVDIPAARRDPAIASYEVLKAQGLQGGGTPPYQYMEIVRVPDMAQFQASMQTPAVQELLATLMTMMDSPQIIVCQSL
jgi:quinol monooxygenase YgiN